MSIISSEKCPLFPVRAIDTSNFSSRSELMHGCESGRKPSSRFGRSITEFWSMWRLEVGHGVVLAIKKKSLLKMSTRKENVRSSVHGEV